MQAVDDLYTRLSAINERLAHIETLERPNPANFLSVGREMCSAYHNTTQTVPDNTAKALALNSEGWDTAGLHDTVTNNSRIYLVAGQKYHIEGWVQWDGADTGSGRREAYVRKNGTTELWGRSTMRQTTTGDNLTNHILSDIEASEGDYIELVAYQTSGADRTVLAARLVVWRIG